MFCHLSVKGNKQIAKCLLCHKVLCNTSKSRLMMHRNICNVNNVLVKEKSDENYVKTEPCILLQESSYPTCNISNSSFSIQENHSSRGKRKRRSINDSDSDIEDPEQLILNLSLRVPSPVQIETNIHRLSSNCTTHNRRGSNSNLNSSILSNESKTNENKFKINCEMPSTENDSVDLKLAAFFFGCNIPFSVIDSDHFISLCQALRPNYSPPSRKTLSSYLLNKVYNNICSNVKFSGESVLLISEQKIEAMDTKYIVCLRHSSTGKTIFLDSFNLLDTGNSSEELTNIINKCIDLSENKHETKIYAVLYCKNATNIMKTGRLSTIWHLPCNSHIANLLPNDVISNKFIEQVKIVLNAFHTPEIEVELLDFNGCCIQIPFDSRWCTYRDSFKNLQDNILSMKKVLTTNNHTFDAEVQKYLFDFNFLSNLSNSITLLDPVCNLIDIYQKSTSSIADVAEVWLDLPNKISSDLKDFNNTILKQQEYVLNEFLLTANFLHPRYQGNKMTSEQKNLVENFILTSSHIGSDGLNSFVEYKEKAGLFGILFAKGNLTTVTFWSIAKNKHSELASFANKLLALPASLEQIERVFAYQSDIYNNLQNELTLDNSKKLQNIYYTLNLSENGINSSIKY